MRIITLIFGFLISLNMFGNEQLGKINDPDGYTNVREKPTTESKVLFKILDTEYFYYECSEIESWCRVTNMNGRSGFMHQSRIKNLSEFTINGKTYQSNESKLKVRTKKIGSTEIKISQIRNPKSYCDAYIEITSNKTKKFKYEFIEALGGSAGIAFLENVVPNHTLIVKHGDYDGRTIIVSKNGQITEVTGGSVSELIDNKYLINLAECDIGYCGFSIYDILQEKIVFSYETEFELYQFKDQIIFDLDYDNGKDYHLFDFDNKEFKKLEIKENIENNYFKRTINYELEKGCLCY
jgi:hypothetical protein